MPAAFRKVRTTWAFQEKLEDTAGFQEDEQSDLKDQDQGHADDEGGVLGFVAEELHAEDGADAAA